MHWAQTHPLCFCPEPTTYAKATPLTPLPRVVITADRIEHWLVPPKATATAAPVMGPGGKHAPTHPLARNRSSSSTNDPQSSTSRRRATASNTSSHDDSCSGDLVRWGDVEGRLPVRRDHLGHNGRPARPCTCGRSFSLALQPAPEHAVDLDLRHFPARGHPPVWWGTRPNDGPAGGAGPSGGPMARNHSPAGPIRPAEDTLHPGPSATATPCRARATTGVHPASPATQGCGSSVATLRAHRPACQIASSSTPMPWQPIARTSTVAPRSLDLTPW